MEKKEFLESIRACRRKLNTRDFLNMLVFALGVGAVVGILFQVIALITPLYYVNLYTLLALALAGLMAFLLAYRKRSTMKQAALVMDSFGFQERIITAYEHLEQDDNIFRLQREDAMRRLAANKESIKIPILPSWKRMVGLAGLFMLLMVLALIPSPMKERAKQLHEIAKVAKEKVEEVEEVVEELEALEQEALTPEQLAALQEMIESLKSSMAEYNQANAEESLLTAGEKLEYKYEDMSNQLSQLAGALQSGAAASVLTAEAMQELADRLQEMSGTQLASNQGQNGNSQGSGQNGDGQGNGQSGNRQGDNPDGSENSDGQDGQGGNGSNGQSGNGGSGEGGDGQGGKGQGGDGSGSGSGRGTGSSSTPHDYVSVPNAIANSENLTGDATNHDTSQYFKTQNGLSWEGERISYETVIGSYEQNAYEGIAADRYPSGMEDVIKEYFASFN